MKAQREIFKNAIVTKYAANILLNWALRLIVDQNFNNKPPSISKGADYNCHEIVHGYGGFSQSVFVALKIFF
jgi:hypothetical protein